MRKSFFAGGLVCAIACAIISIGGIVFAVTAQAQQCTFTPSPAVVEAGHSGGTYTINFTASGSTCNWNISSADDWITVPDTHKGTGSGTIVVTVKPNTGAAARQGRVVLNRQYIWVNQPQRPPCTYTLNQTSRSIAAGGTPGNYDTVLVKASDASCTWNVGEASPWIHVTPGTKTGTASVRYTIGANASGSTRTGTIKIAGQTFTVTQEACTYTLNQTSRSIAAGGTPGNYDTVLVKASDASCTWNVGEASPWIHVTPGTKTGTASVRYTIGANASGSTRTGTIKIAGQTFTVTQEACTYTVSPTSLSFSGNDHNKPVHITTNSGDCKWTIDETASWIGVQPPTKSGTGTRYVSVTVQPNRTGTARSAVVKINNTAVNVTQTANPCTYAVSPASIDHSASRGGTGFSVTTNHQDCPWTVETTAGWIGIGSNTRSGKGSASVHIQFMENQSTAARSTVIKVKTASVNVTQLGRTAAQATQASGGSDPTSAQMSAGSSHVSRAPVAKTSPAAPSCSYTLSKTSQNVGQGDARGSFSVKTDSGCEWKAVANAPWIIIASASSGKGKGTVKFAVEENRGSSPRTGQISVVGQTFSINQKGQKTGNKEKKHR